MFCKKTTFFPFFATIVYFVEFENVVGKYEDLIIRKIRDTGKGMLKEITADLETLDSIRCFFAILFLARDQKIELEQNDGDIMITLAENIHKDEKKHGKN